MKSLNTSPTNPATEVVKDIEKFGNVDQWTLLCKVQKM